MDIHIVLIFAPLKSEIKKTNIIGNKFILNKNNIFLSADLKLNFFIFLKDTIERKAIKNKIIMPICFKIKISGFKKCLIKVLDSIPVLFIA